MVIKAHLVCCSCHLLLARCSYQSVVSFMHLQYSPQVISAGQENPNQSLLLDENVPGCSGGLCNTTQHMANTFSPCSTNQQPSFFALSRAHPCEDAGNYQRHVRLVGWQSATPLTGLSPENSTFIWTSNYHQVHSRHKLHSEQIRR